MSKNKLIPQCKRVMGIRKSFVKDNLIDPDVQAITLQQSALNRRRKHQNVLTLLQKSILSITEDAQ